MQDYFFSLTDFIAKKLSKDTVFTAYFSGEASDFVRFNRGKIRQAGTVNQGFLSLDVIRGKKHCQTSIGVSGTRANDESALSQMIQTSLDRLADLPDDPHLLYATEVHSSSTTKDNKLPKAQEIVDEILPQVADTDFVGIYAGGAIYRGFANSFGQKNWLTNHSFNVDFCLYYEKDKATKNNYAGFSWDKNAFSQKMAFAKENLAILQKPAKTINPGRYGVYLTPSAVNEIFSLLSWDGFGLKSIKTKQSPLCRLADRKEQMSPMFTLTENTGQGIGAQFQSAGFMKPATTALIAEGQYRGSLISPRSAAQYDMPTNGANGAESPESLDMAPGSLSKDKVLTELGSGLYISNLWYLNYSDKPAGRMTGMTRFATFWVEKGQIVAPVNVMRFDDSIYRVFGKNLVALTKERDFIIDPSSYEERSTNSACLPGALVKDFELTL